MYRDRSREDLVTLLVMALGAAGLFGYIAFRLYSLGKQNGVFDARL